MINELLIENYRSIKSQHIKLGTMNFLIGSNNAGKSNIMKALNLIIGETYPTKAFDDRDFYNYDKTKVIKIEVRFDSVLSCNTNIQGFRLTFDGSNTEYYALNSSFNVARYSYPTGREIRVTNEMRDEVALLYLGLDRQASQQVKSTQWSLFGKLLRYIEKNLPPQQKQAFQTDIQGTYQTNIQPNLSVLENILRTHIKSQTGLDLSLRLSVMDPLESLKNLKPYLSETGCSREDDAEDMGAGTQSALSVAIARAYGQIVRKPLMLAIEEPELFLHPHGCRHFLRLLKKLAAGSEDIIPIQIICTTHENCFIDISNYRSIHRVCKESTETKVNSGINLNIPVSRELPTISKFDEQVNESLLAMKVVLVEGPADKIACKIAFETLGFDIDQMCISVIDCNGISSIIDIARVLKGFKIEVLALVDEDPGNPITARHNQNLQTLLGSSSVFLQSPNLESLFGFTNKPSKADALVSLPSWFASNPVPPMYSRIMTILR
ncbi:MAG: AAA family ATPase [Dehalogenimonas sp.]